MAYKCCAPNCKTGYEEYEESKQTGSSGEKAKGKKRKKKIIGETLSVTKFPDCEKESATRAQWVAKVPWENWKPGKDEVPRICELHFQEKHFIQESSDTDLQ